MAKFMVIEHLHAGKRDAVYKRFHDRGRLLPDGLLYIDSWLEKDGDRCFQLIETRDKALFSEWTRNWDDLADFEIIEIGEKPGTAEKTV